jgi:prephenate dehydrogenase
MLNNLLSKKNVLIIGLGLIGASYALSLKTKCENVYGFDTDLEVLSYAREKQMIVYSDLPLLKLVEMASLIIIAIKPNKVFDVFLKIAPYIKDDCFVTDVAGIKNCFYNKIIETIDIRNYKFKYKSHHPMAGKAELGIKNASIDLFKEANFIICFDKDDDYDILKELATALNFKRYCFIDIDKHDKVITYISQLTHIIAVLLMVDDRFTHLESFVGDSFRDLTRIAKIDKNLWTDLFLDNSMYLSADIDLFISRLTSIKEILKAKDKKELEMILENSYMRRKKFEEGN